MLDLHRILGVTACAGRRIAVTALLGAGLLLSGCGQKGPLFLPAPPTTTAEPAVVDAISNTTTVPAHSKPER